MQKLSTDAPISSDCTRHLLYIGADRFAQISDLVYERNLHGQEGIGGIFGKFRRLRADKDDRCTPERERLVQALHHLAAFRIVAADEYAIGMGKITNGRPFAQEFRI